ncbi:MAG TPA: YfhO family protein [Candidatus Binatia bacterium]|nr:YfhO family protein [Candidatus Binatia bacterium]
MTARLDGWKGDLAVGMAAAGLFLAAWLAGGSLWEQVNSGDLHGMFLPWYEYVARALWHEGRVPLWQPWQFCGTPVLGLGQTGSLYPPVLIMFGLLSPWAALQALYTLHVAILGTGVAAVLRLHGIGRLPALVATLVAVAVLLRGPLLAAVDHPSFLACMAWSPWVLFCWERAMTGSARRWTAGIAFASAMQWVAGYPDFPLDFAVLLGVVALVADVGLLRRRVGVAVVGLGLGAALAAVQLLPIADTLRESIRTEEGAEQQVVRMLFSIFTPEQLALTARDTWGPAAFLLALAALVRPDRRRVAWAVAFVWSVFAVHRPFAWLYLLPPWSSVRFAFGWSGGTALFLGLLAATGIATTLASSRRVVRALGVVLAVLATTQALLVVWRSPTALPAYWPGHLAFRAPVVPQAAERARLLAEAMGDDRALAERDGRAGEALRQRIRLVLGHEPSVVPRRIAHLLDAAELDEKIGMFRDYDWRKLAERPALASLLGIGVVAISPTKAVPLEHAGFTRVGTLPGGDVMLRRAARPRVRLVHRAEIAPGGEAGSLAAVLRAPEDTVLDEGSVHPPLAGAPPDAHEAARIVDEAPERILIEATVAAPALLVLGDTANDGWRADVDGMPAPILHADHAFRAVWLPAGQHTVVFTYAPWSVRIGLMVSLLAAVVTVAMLVMPGRIG